MFEKLARQSYRYFKEAKVYVIFTMCVFGFYTFYNQVIGWKEGQLFQSLMLFVGVFGNAIVAGFCLCVFYLCFLYAFHPELNGKTDGNTRKLLQVRVICVLIALSNLALLVSALWPSHHV